MSPDPPPRKAPTFGSHFVCDQKKNPTFSEDPSEGAEKWSQILRGELI